MAPLLQPVIARRSRSDTRGSSAAAEPAPLLYPMLGKEGFEGFVHHCGFGVTQLLNELFELRKVGSVDIVGLALIDAFKLFFFFLGAWTPVFDQVSPRVSRFFVFRALCWPWCHLGWRSHRPGFNLGGTRSCGEAWL